MNSMFNGCVLFNENITTWDVGNVTTILICLMELIFNKILVGGMLEM